VSARNASLVGGSDYPACAKSGFVAFAPQWHDGAKCGHVEARATRDYVCLLNMYFVCSCVYLLSSNTS
jgi:hypothetical protein